MFLRAMLFWSMFLPLGHCWSIDARRRAAADPGTAGPGRQAVSVATIAYFLQIGFVYWFAVAHKSDPHWWSQGTAVYYALNVDQLVTPFGQWLLKYPDLLRILTHATMALEAFGPVLLFIPWRTAMFRSLAVALFAGFHIGMAMSMHLGMFSETSIVAWLPFLPGAFWDRLAGWKGTVTA